MRQATRNAGHSDVHFVIIVAAYRMADLERIETNLRMAYETLGEINRAIA